MRQLIRFAMALPVLFVLGAPAFLTTGTPELVVHAQQRSGGDELEILPVQGSVYLLAGAGANITVQVDDAGLVLVDSGNAASSERVLAALRRISPKPIRYIINTQFHDDHNGGNEPLAKANRNPPVIAHERVLRRMSAPVGSVSPRRVGEWPTDTFFSPIKDLYNGEAIQIFYQPAQTDGDSFVVFRRSDVISAGDTLMTTTYPIVDVQAGGNIAGVIEGLNRILDITVPIDKQENGTLVVPGHGRICDEADVVEYRDMVTIVRDRVLDAVKRRQTLAQVKAANLTLDFDGRYGATAGPWTTDMFLEAVYKNLSSGVPAPSVNVPSKTKK